MTTNTPSAGGAAGSASKALPTMSHTYAHIPTYRQMLPLLACAAVFLLLGTAAVLKPAIPALMIASLPRWPDAVGNLTTIRSTTPFPDAEPFDVDGGKLHLAHGHDMDERGAAGGAVQPATEQLGVDREHAVGEAGPGANAQSDLSTGTHLQAPADSSLACVPVVAVATVTSQTLDSSAATLKPLLDLAAQCNHVSVVVYMDYRAAANAESLTGTSGTQGSRTSPAHVRDVTFHYPKSVMAHMHTRYMNLYDIPPAKRQLLSPEILGSMPQPAGRSSDFAWATRRTEERLAFMHITPAVDRILRVAMQAEPIGVDHVSIAMHRSHLEVLLNRTLPNGVTVVPFMFPDHALDDSDLARETAIAIATLHATLHISNHPQWSQRNDTKQRADVPPLVDGVHHYAGGTGASTGLAVVGLTSSTVIRPAQALLRMLSVQSPTLCGHGFMMVGSAVSTGPASVNELAPVDWRVRLNMDINAKPYQQTHAVHALEALALAAPLAAQGLVSSLMALYCAASLHCLLPVEPLRTVPAVKARVLTLMKVAGLAYTGHEIRTVLGEVTVMLPASHGATPLSLGLRPGSAPANSEAHSAAVDERGFGPEPEARTRLVATSHSPPATRGAGTGRANLRAGAMAPYAQAYSRLRYGRKRFVYLVQGESWATSNVTVLDHADLPDVDVVLLCWGKPCHDASRSNIHTIFAPHSSWNEGRNRLMWAAIELEQSVNEGPYEFFGFMDEDVKLHCAAGTGGVCARELQGVLDKYRAPITTARWFDICDVEKSEVSYTDVFDAIYNVFHRLAVGSFLPYHEDFDHVSWYTSQAILSYQAVCVRGHVVQANNVWVTNGMHRAYPRGATCKQDLVAAHTSVVPSSLRKHVNWGCSGCVLKGHHPPNEMTAIDPSTLAPGWATHVCNATMLADGLHAKSVSVPLTQRFQLRQASKGKKKT